MVDILERTKHDYTSELELKSLLIRVKNRKTVMSYPLKYNSTINKYINTYVNLNNTKYTDDRVQRKKEIKQKLKDRIIELSIKTNIDERSHENFGAIVLLMIKSILTKPNFSGYTYKTDFYSDAIHKVLKYLHNFQYDMISERSGIQVNAFAYISQIIHNSIVYVINTKKKELENQHQQFSTEIIDHNLDIINHRRVHKSTIETAFDHDIKQEFKIKVKTNIVDEVRKIREKLNLDEKVIIYYPGTYNISMTEFDELRPYIKNTSIVRY